MASRTFKVKSYEINMGDKVSIPIQGSPVRCLALIQCHGGPTESLDIFIVSDSQNRANTTRFAESILGRIFVPPEHFPWYLDLLRNEEVLAILDELSPAMNRLTCTAPAGWGHLG
jgi:hypothetical protein